MTSASSADLLEATLRPALRLPFRPTQPARPRADTSGAWPEPEEAYQVLWRAGAGEVATAFPGLWALPRARLGNDDGGCVDLVIDVDALGGLVAVDVEAVPVAHVLVALGDLDGAAVAQQAIGQPVEVAGPAVADLLARLWVLAEG